MQVYLQQGREQGTNGAAAAAAGEEAGLQSGRWTDIAKLLSRKHDRIDPLHALSLLPDGVRDSLACLIIGFVQTTCMPDRDVPGGGGTPFVVPRNDWLCCRFLWHQCCPFWRARCGRRESGDAMHPSSSRCGRRRICSVGRPPSGAARGARHTRHALRYTWPCDLPCRRILDEALSGVLHAGQST